METTKNLTGTGNYSDQYRDPRWLKRRDEILEIDRYQCKRCGSSEHLQVHHVFYSALKDVWEYGDEELFTLCDSCHKRIHYLKSCVNDHLNELMRRWCFGDKNSKADYESAYSVLDFLNRGQQTRVYSKICLEAGLALEDKR